MCVKKSAFKKVILSDFFKNTSLSCFGQPSGERQTHFAFFSPLSPSLFPFVQSNSFVMRQFLFPLYAPAFIRAKNALILSRLNARCWLIRSQFLVSVRKAIALRFIRTSTARSAATASPGNRTFLFFPWFYGTAVENRHIFDFFWIFYEKTFEKSRERCILSASSKVVHDSSMKVSEMVLVAQLVRAPGCGPGGRGFKSHLPPHFFAFF